MHAQDKFGRAMLSWHDDILRYEESRYRVFASLEYAGPPYRWQPLRVNTGLPLAMLAAIPI